MNSKITLDVVQSNLVLEGFTTRINNLEADDKEQDDLFGYYSDLLKINRLVVHLKELKEDLETIIEKGKKTFTFKTKFSSLIIASLDSLYSSADIEKNLMCEKIKQKIYKANGVAFGDVN